MNLYCILFHLCFVDPSTGEELGQLPEMTVEDTKKAIAAASEAFPSWSQTTAKVGIYELGISLASVLIGITESP
jgi:hypothetical protein